MRANGTLVWTWVWKVVTIASMLAATQAAGQGYPNQPVKLIVPFAAGGGTDVTARLVAEQLRPRLGAAVVVENRPGASASVGAGSVARSVPNGYTLLVGTATLAANTVVSGPSEGFDLLNDFEFIGKMGQLDLMIVTNPASKLDDLQALVNLMRAQPGKVTFGSPGIGSPAHLGGELLKQLTKADAVHVPYKGESAALNDLLAGQVTFQLCGVNVCIPRAQQGQLKALAVTAKKRSTMGPTIPTTAEAGVPGVEAGTWYFVAAPKGTPAAIVDKLNAALNDVYADEKFRTRLADQGVELEPGTTGAAVKAALQAEMDKWRPVVKAAGIKN